MTHAPAFKVVIPARYGSSRLPGKPLRMLAGRPMIGHVYDRAVASGADEVIVATDDARIQEAVQAFGGQSMFTAVDHPSGTDRIEEVSRKRGWDEETIVVNLQGDEPLMPSELLRQVAKGLAEHREAAIATLCTPVEDIEQLFDPNVVKVVCNHRCHALIFTRAPVPWNRGEFTDSRRAQGLSGIHMRHIGLYAYRVGFLRRYVTWPSCALEEIESLEQLRALWHGETIYVDEAVTTPGHGVDTESDLVAVEEIMGRKVKT